MGLETSGDGGSEGLEISEQPAEVHIELKLRAMMGRQARHLAKQTLKFISNDTQLMSLEEIISFLLPSHIVREAKLSRKPRP